MENPTVQQITAGIRSGMYASRPTIKEAYEEFTKTTSAARAGEVLISVHVLLNTISNELNKAFQVETKLADEMLDTIIDTLEADGDLDAMDFDRMRRAANLGEAMRKARSGKVLEHQWEPTDSQGHCMTCTECHTSIHTEHEAWDRLMDTPCPGAPQIDIKQAIFEHYGTTDIEQIYNDAASKRSGSAHMETPLPGGEIICDTCGKIGAGKGDPLFHPEQYLNI